VDGSGELSRDTNSRIPNMRDHAWHSQRTDQQLRSAILGGKGRSMPAMRRVLSDGDADLLVKFVRGFAGGRQVVEDEPEASPAAALPPVRRPPIPDPRVTSEVVAFFRRHCINCHGRDGRGSTLRESAPQIPDLTNHAWNERRSDAQLMASILDGKGNRMPAFRDRLGPIPVDGLIAHLRSFDPSHTKRGAAQPDQFEQRYRQLQEKMDALRRDYRRLAPSQRRPLTSARSTNQSAGSTPERK
jgi:mono/diheme cytochrome c family protein